MLDWFFWHDPPTSSPGHVSGFFLFTPLSVHHESLSHVSSKSGLQTMYFNLFMSYVICDSKCPLSLNIQDDVLFWMEILQKCTVRQATLYILFPVPSCTFDSPPTHPFSPSVKMPPCIFKRQTVVSVTSKGSEILPCLLLSPSKVEMQAKQCVSSSKVWSGTDPACSRRWEGIGLVWQKVSAGTTAAWEKVPAAEKEETILHEWRRMQQEEKIWEKIPS